MVVTILSRDQTPVTINEWQESLRKEIQRQKVISATFGNRNDNFPYKPQWKPSGRRWFKDLDAMEIDGMEIDPEVIEEQPMEIEEVTIGKRPERAGKLTAEQKQRHLKQGRCFVCGQQGHIARKCLRREGKGTTKQQVKAVTMEEIKDEQKSYQEEAEEDSQQVREEDEKPPSYDVSIGAHIRAMSIVDRDYLISWLMEAEESGF